MTQRILVFLFICSSYNFSQYSIRDSSLLKSLFFRAPDRQLILQYLMAKEPDSVRAGLLAAANMPDSQYILPIMLLPFSSFGKEICFTLNNQPSIPAITEYLWDIYSLNLRAEEREIVVEAIGNSGSMNDFKTLYTWWSEQKQLAGISLAIYNFRIRQIKDDSLQKMILLSELKSNDSFRKNKAAFVLSRFGKVPELINWLEQVLHIYAEGKDIQTQAALLLLYRRNTDSLKTLTFIRPYLKSSEYIVSIEAISALKKFKFSDDADCKPILGLIDQNNQAILVHLASQLRQNTFSPKAVKIITDALEGKINILTGPNPAEQEMILTLFYLNKHKVNEYLLRYEGKLSRSNWYRALELLNTESRVILSHVLSEFAGFDQPVRLQTFTQMFSPEVQKEFANDGDYKKYIKMILQSGESPLISTFADGITAEFLSTDEIYIKSTLLTYLKTRINDAHFNEALLSLINFFKKYYPAEIQQIEAIVASSSLSSIAGLIPNNIKSNVTPEREQLFSQILQSAFAYTEAEITTTQGTIRIKLNTEVAPLTAGNFVKLAREKFFDGIVFHRVVPGFVIQAGDRTGTGWGGPGYEIVSEYSWLTYEPYTVGMASAGKDTEGSQWFITNWHYPHLNGRYTIFGKSSEGFETINVIPQGTYIQSVRVF